MKFKDILFLIWPPLELRNVQRKIEEKYYEIDFDKIRTQVENRIDEKNPNSNEFQDYLQKVLESEEKRKETLEAKALQYFSTFSITSTIFSFFPIVISRTNSIPKYLVIFLCFFYLLAMTHFVSAILESVNARKITQYFLPNIDDIIKSNKTGPFKSNLNLAVKAKANEHIMLKKANHISISEVMFSRGLFFILLTTIVFLIAA